MTRFLVSIDLVSIFYYYYYYSYFYKIHINWKLYTEPSLGFKKETGKDGKATSEQLLCGGKCQVDVSGVVCLAMGFLTEAARAKNWIMQGWQTGLNNMSVSQPRWPERHQAFTLHHFTKTITHYLTSLIIMSALLKIQIHFQGEYRIKTRLSFWEFTSQIDRIEVNESTTLRREK